MQNFTLSENTAENIIIKSDSECSHIKNQIRPTSVSECEGADDCDIPHWITGNWSNVKIYFNTNGQLLFCFYNVFRTANTISVESKQD